MICFGPVGVFGCLQELNQILHLDQDSLEEKGTGLVHLYFYSMKESHHLRESHAP